MGMAEMTPEERARVIIDRLLEQAGWTFDVEEYAPGSERSGFADYKLFDRAGTGGLPGPL